MDVIRAGGKSNRNRAAAENKSPDRVKLYVQPKMKPFRKVQVLYYLCRNGQLEHPHFMEVTHLTTQHLRLKDVIDRLMVLRGKIMPSLFSWSCKRCYKNGYVWNDLSENDIIYPAEGAEYILKGSELTEACAEKFQQLQLVTNKQLNPEVPKRRLLVEPHHHYQNREPELEYMREAEVDEEEEEMEEEEEEEDQEKESNDSTSSNKSSSRFSRGVSTNASPPPSSSSLSEKAPPPPPPPPHDSVTERTVLTRSSALFQLIACGSSAAGKERNASYCARKSSSSRESLHKGVLCKSAAMNKMTSQEEDEINYMPENPRFGNPQSEEKEYFSGSIVESITEVDRVRLTTDPSLKKSSSYNEERSSKSGLEKEMMEKKVEEEKKSMKGKCIPRKKVISSFVKKAKK